MFTKWLARLYGPEKSRPIKRSTNLSRLNFPVVGRVRSAYNVSRTVYDSTKEVSKCMFLDEVAPSQVYGAQSGFTFFFDGHS